MSSFEIILTLIALAIFGIPAILQAITLIIVYRGTSDEIQHDEQGIPYHETVKFDEESLFMKTFEMNRYDYYAEKFFKDFNDKTSKLTNFVTFKIAIRTLGVGLALLYASAPFAAAIVLIQGIIQQTSFNYLATYYYFTYYEVGIKLVKEDKEDS